jgi:DNA-binding CsgD family transcriptional regulator/tetratricopeptide (TPR) repeat protein
VELATVVEALVEPPALVLVEGEAGIGKTRLVSECLHAPPLRRRTVLEAVCPPLAEPFPLGPVVDALHRQWRRVGEVPLSPLAGALRPLFPERAADLPPAPEPLGDLRATRHRLFRALAELLERLGVDILLLEDAHWADSATLELLLTLGTAGSPSLVVTYRPTDVPPGSLLLRLTSHTRTGLTRARVAPEPLTLAETRQLIASMFATEQVAADFVDYLHERTQGMPLALEESLSLLRDRGDIVRRGGEWTRREIDQLRVPPTVRDSVLERVDRLDPVARRILEAAAVLAEPADEDLLAAVADLGADGTRRGLAGALASGLLREAEPGRFVVRHVLASRAVEEAVPISERRRLHRLAGHALQVLDQPPAVRLSRHFREAGDVESWRRFAETAAELALASGDDRTAVVSLHELLSTADPPPEHRAHLARKLGEAAAGGVAALGELGGQVTRALRDVMARDDVPTGEHGHIRLLLGRLLVQLGEFDEAYEQFQAAVDELAERPELAVRAMVALAFPRGNDWPAGRHLAWLDRAAALLPRVPSPADRLSVAADRAMSLLLLGEQAGWDAAAEIGDDAETLPERRQVARSLMNVGHVAIASGHFAYARQRLLAAEELMRATGYERLLNSASLTRAYLDWHTGDWTDLAARVTTLVATVDTLPEAHLEARLILAQLDLAGGRRDAAEQELREVLAEATRRGLADTQMSPAGALGRLYLTDGDAEEALRVTSPGIDIINRKGVWLWATDIAPVHAEALARSGQLATAQSLVERFADGIAGRNMPAPAAAVLAARAAIAEATGDVRSAADGFAAAARAWAALPRPYEELLAMERSGRCEYAAGDHQPALKLLAKVQERLWALGARRDADRVAHLLRQHGVEIIRAWRGGRRGYGDQLSPRELQVVRLVARGLTNRKVADHLFLSPRTVDRHLSGAMQKLGVTSRTALAVTAADAGLLDDGNDKPQP